MVESHLKGRKKAAMDTNPSNFNDAAAEVVRKAREAAAEARGDTPQSPLIHSVPAVCPHCNAHLMIEINPDGTARLISLDEA